MIDITERFIPRRCGQSNPGQHADTVYGKRACKHSLFAWNVGRWLVTDSPFRSPFPSYFEELA
jgi:hypothetical protein